MEGYLLPVLVFILVYAAISLELVNKAVAALLGVTILLICHVTDIHNFAHFIDFETLMLLLGMMSIVAILRKAGFFTILSVKIAELTKGSPLKILVLFSIVTALLSAFLDNVTTVLIIVPIVIELTSGMGLDPKLFVISQAIISNIGGTSTLVGDPPNIIIGSKVGLSFNAFLVNLAPICIVMTAVGIIYIWLAHKTVFKPINTNATRLFIGQLLLEKIRRNFLETHIDKVFLIKSLTCLGIAILLFVTQAITHITSGVVAILIAMLLIIITKVDVEEVLEEIEWSTLLFFMGLFVLVGILEEKGVIEWLAKNIFLKAGNNPYVLVLLVLWASGIISGILDNIPFTMTMIPIVNIILETNSIPNNILWWALSLGACLGGNLTMIGASANIVSIGVAKKLNVNITFIDFFKESAIITIITLIISSAYILFYLWLSL